MGVELDGMRGGLDVSTCVCGASCPECHAWMKGLMGFGIEIAVDFVLTFSIARLYASCSSNTSLAARIWDFNVGSSSTSTSSVPSAQRSRAHSRTQTLDCVNHARC